EKIPGSRGDSKDRAPSGPDSACGKGSSRSRRRRYRRHPVHIYPLRERKPPTLFPSPPFRGSSPYDAHKAVLPNGVETAGRFERDSNESPVFPWPIQGKKRGSFLCYRGRSAGEDWGGSVSRIEGN